MLIYTMAKILAPGCKPIFHLADGPGGIWHPSAFSFLPGGPFWVPELKLVKLTSIPPLLFLLLPICSHHWLHEWLRREYITIYCHYVWGRLLINSFHKERLINCHRKMINVIESRDNVRVCCINAAKVYVMPQDCFEVDESTALCIIRASYDHIGIILKCIDSDHTKVP